MSFLKIFSKKVDVIQTSLQKKVSDCTSLKLAKNYSLQQVKYVKPPKLEPKNVQNLENYSLWQDIKNKANPLISNRVISMPQRVFFKVETRLNLDFSSFLHEAQYGKMDNRKLERKIVKSTHQVCDLHNLKSKQAYAYLKQALINAINNHQRVLEVVTGKSGAVIKSSFLEWMEISELRRLVINYRLKNEGSFLLVLRKNKNNP